MMGAVLAVAAKECQIVIFTGVPERNSISSPPWHEKILNDRENGISNGEAVFVDLNTAKKNIENSLTAVLHKEDD